MNDVLFVWLADILDYRLARAGAGEAGLGERLLAGFRRFQPGRATSSAPEPLSPRGRTRRHGGHRAAARALGGAARRARGLDLRGPVRDRRAVRRGRHPRVGDPRLRAHLEAAVRALGRHDARAAAAAQRGGHARRPSLRSAPPRRRGRQRRGRPLRHVARSVRQLRRAAAGRSRQRPPAPSLGHQPGAPSLDPVPHRHELVQRPLDDRPRAHPDGPRAGRRFGRSRIATCPTGPAAGSSTRTSPGPAPSTTSARASSRHPARPPEPRRSRHVPTRRPAPPARAVHRQRCRSALGVASPRRRRRGTSRPLRYRGIAAGCRPHRAPRPAGGRLRHRLGWGDAPGRLHAGLSRSHQGSAGHRLRATPGLPGAGPARRLPRRGAHLRPGGLRSRDRGRADAGAHQPALRDGPAGARDPGLPDRPR